MGLWLCYRWYCGGNSRHRFLLLLLPSQKGRVGMFTGYCVTHWCIWELRLYCRVGVSANTYGLRLDIDDGHDGSCNKSFEEVIYFLIWCSPFWYHPIVLSRVVPMMSKISQTRGVTDTHHQPFWTDQTQTRYNYDPKTKLGYLSHPPQTVCQTSWPRSQFPHCLGLVRHRPRVCVSFERSSGHDGRRPSLPALLTENIVVR